MALVSGGAADSGFGDYITVLTLGRGKIKLFRLGVESLILNI